MNWINRYEKFMLEKLMPVDNSTSDLEYLRNVIFFKCLLYIFPFGLIVLIPGTIYAIHLQQFKILFFSLTTYGTMFIITIPSKIKITLKKAIL
jgi:hypothetical protein